MQYLAKSINYVIICVVFLIALSLFYNINIVSAANLEITSPDDEFYVVAKYDFEVNNPENFTTPYYWWAVFDKQNKVFLEKYFQKNISSEEALNNNKLEDVVFLKPGNYRIAVVYCPIFVSDPTNLGILQTNGCSYTTIENLQVRDIIFGGTTKGVALPEDNPIYGSAPNNFWILSGSPPNKELFYIWGIYSFDLNKILIIEPNKSKQGLNTGLGLGKYTVGLVVCNHPLQIGEEDPLEFYDAENCIIKGRRFEVVEGIHMEPLFVQSGEKIKIKGSMPRDDWTEFDKIKVIISKCIGYDCQEIGKVDLFDDGKYQDGIAGDDIWGNFGNTKNQPIAKYRLESKSYLGETEKDTLISYAYITASPNQCMTLEDNGPIEDKLDILFIGESFDTLENLLEPINIQKKYFTGEYGIEPFKSNDKKINLRVSTYLLQDLCEDVSFSCRFDPSNYLHCPYDKVIYFTTHKSWSYATLGGVWAIVSLMDYYDPYPNYLEKETQTTVHEFGHSFGSLMDEYRENYGDMPGKPNCADSIEDAMNWWGDKVGLGKGVLQVLSASELSILGTGSITEEEFIDKYGGWPNGWKEYQKCLLDLDECINKNEFLSINKENTRSEPTGRGCSYTEDNFRPTMLSVMKSNVALQNFIDDGLQLFRDYYWWQHWHGPVNEAHLQGLLNNYK